MKLNLGKKVLGLILLASVAGLAACSSSGSGTEGEGGLSESDLNAQREGRFAGGGIPTAEGEGLFRDINFEYDSAVVTDQGRREIEQNAKTMGNRSDIKVELEGHTDERGTAEYNLALGAQRAKAVKDLLISFGISPSRIESVSYGEEVPLNASHGEQAWAENRRVHFSGFREVLKR